MITKSLLKEARITEVISATTAGTSTIASSAVDMANYENVVFITSLGTAAADNGHKVNQSSDDGSADDYTDLLGSSLLCNGTGKVVVSEVIRPTKRYVKCSVVRGTSTTINNCICIRWGAKTKSVTNTVTNSMNTELLVSPAEGTA